MARKKKIDIDPTLAPRIQSLLEDGLTVGMTCARVGINQDTYYEYVKTIPEFSDMVTRAQQVALIKAVETFRSGFETQKANEVQIDEFSETRIGKDGKPYTYTKKTTRKKVVEQPPDWRAGEAYVKRRDSQNWSEKLYLEFELDIGKVLEWARLLKDFDLSAGDVMEKMLQKLHEQKAAQHVDR